MSPGAEARPFADGFRGYEPSYFAFALPRMAGSISFGTNSPSPENSPDMLAVEAEFMLNCLLSVN